MDKYLYNESLGLYRIPPFRDAHVHFIQDGRPLTDDELAAAASAFKRKGIFAVNDMGHKSKIGLRARQIAGTLLEVRTSVAAIFRKGGYGAFLGQGVETVGEITGTIAKMADSRADFIKVINSGVVDITGGGRVTAGGFSVEEIRVICDEAKERALAISCHANGDRAIRSAAEAGVSTIEHGFFVSHETLRMMAEAGVSWTPTAYALLSLKKRLPAAQHRYIDEVVGKHLASIEYAASGGVRLLVGTDSGSGNVSHGDSFFEELKLFGKARLSMEQILAAACMDEAEIEKGNFLLVKEDFIETGRIEAVSPQVEVRSNSPRRG